MWGGMGDGDATVMAMGMHVVRSGEGGSKAMQERDRLWMVCLTLAQERDA